MRLLRPVAAATKCCISNLNVFLYTCVCAMNRVNLREFFCGGKRSVDGPPKTRHRNTVAWLGWG
jgi:hypothetical protein